MTKFCIKTLNMEKELFVEYEKRAFDSLQRLSTRDYDINKLCRICLVTENSNMVSLLKNNEFLSKMLMFLSLISVDQNDGLPSNICEPCETMLLSCYEFKLKCQRSDSVLKTLLKNEYSTKDEPIEEESVSNIDVDDNKDEIFNDTSSLEYSVINDNDQPVKEEKELSEDLRCFEQYKDTSMDDLICTIQDISKKEDKNLSVAVTDSKCHLKDVISKKKTKKLLMFGKSFKCTFCTKKFYNAKKLQDHIILKHGEAIVNPAFACSECKNTFNSESDFHLHLALHTEGNWTCNRCYKEFKSKSGLGRHIKRHMESKPYSCQNCDKSFTELYALRRHCRVHTGLKAEKKYACKHCEKRYSDNHSLTQHMASQHNGARPYVCEVCKKGFPSPRLLASHKNVHSEYKRYACKLCEKKFRHKSTRNAHYRTHTGEKPYICSTCGKSFIQHTNMTLHMRQHTGEKPYACTMCDRKFASRTTLVNHLSTHTGEKPFSCNVCGKRFARRGLKTHMRQHTGERPHVCSFCPKTFSNATRLREHSRTHTGEKPFECHNCGHKCGSKSHLVDHLKAHHRNEKERKQMDEKIRQDYDKTNSNVLNKPKIDASECKKEILDTQEIPLEVSEELVLCNSGTAIEGNEIPDDKNGICLSNGANDHNYTSDANSINVEDEIKSNVVDRSTVKLYQVDQSLVQIHSSGGQLTISKITSKMTANF